MLNSRFDVIVQAYSEFLEIPFEKLYPFLKDCFLSSNLFDEMNQPISDAEVQQLLILLRNDRQFLLDLIASFSHEINDFLTKVLND